MLRIAISGFGRIGKNFLRAAVDLGAIGKTFEIVAINTRSGVAMHAHLLKYDSVYGRWEGKIEASEGKIKINGRSIQWIQETDPAKLPWKTLNVDWVVESSGEFREREDVERHLSAGAKKVLITAPAKNADVTIVPGVNDEAYKTNMKIVSLASCTTNALAPPLKVLDETFGIERGFLTTVHAYTNDQRIHDASHTDWRRARAGAMNIIPTTTGAAKAIGLVIPELNGRMDGAAFRVPVACGSINDIVLLLKRAAGANEINAALKKAAEGKLKGIMRYSEEELVSSDIIYTTESSIIDGKLTKAIGNLVKINAWYDNEYGYSCRLVDFLKKVAKG